MRTISVEEYRQIVGTASAALEPDKKPAKYRNEPVVVDGIRFDSKAEYRRWCDLQTLERAGQITGLQRQVFFRYCIGGRLMFTYRADAVYHENGKLVVEDTKGGATTPLFRLKKKIIEAEFGVTIREHRQ